jgi:hypothetical protein
MARKWLGVSGKKYQQMPHAETPPASLWWYACEPDPTWADDVPLPESQCVIETYLLQCKRGRALPTGFGKKLAQWLQDLSREPKISPHRKRYWTIPAYALAQKLPEKTLCKRLREMEKIAKRLFPQRVPSNRQTVPLSEEKIQAIRERFIEVGDIRAVAHHFGISPFRIGQICRVEKALIAGEEDTATTETKTSSAVPDLEYPFDG